MERRGVFCEIDAVKSHAAARRRGAVLGLAILLAGAPALRAQAVKSDPEVAAGWVAFDNGNNAAALAAWRAAAARGIGAAHFGLGVLYLNGAGVKADEAEARRMFERGAAKDDPESLLALGEMAMQGQGGPTDVERAVQFLNRAASAAPVGSRMAERAQDLLTSIDLLDAGSAARMSDLKEKENAANDTRPGAEDFRAGNQAYESSDFARAVTALKRAASQGHPRAFWLLGIIYEGGRGVPQDRAEARRLFAAGAAKGDPGAMLLLAHAWHNGRGGPEDPAQAKFWFQKTSEHPDASRVDRKEAAQVLSQLSDVTAVVSPRALESPKLLALTTPAAPAAPAAPATTVVSAVPPVALAAQVTAPTKVATAATTVELEPPSLEAGSDGKQYLPIFDPKRAPWSIERVWRQQLAAAESMPTPTNGRELAVVAYVKAVEAAPLTPKEKQALIRARVDELALLDFYTLSLVDVAFLRENRHDFMAQYLTPAQRADVERVRASFVAARRDGKKADFAGFPYGTGWAAPDLAAASRAQQAGDEAQRVRALRGAAAKGSPEAMRLLAECYREGKGVAADPELALRWTHWAATKEHIPALRQLADYREKGIGLPADAVQARFWQSKARDALPPVKSRPRVSLKAESHDFAAYLACTWEVTLRFNGGRTLNTHYRFARSGTGFVVHYDERSDKPGTSSVGTTERQYSTYDARTYKVLNFDFGGRRFEGHLDGGSLRGSFPTGTWSGNRRIDLDYADLADAALRDGRHEDAIHYYTEAIAVRRFDRHFERRSAIYYALTDYEPAIADLDVVLSIDGKNEIGLVNRSLAHNGAGNYEAAIADATRVLALQPKDNVRRLAVHTRAQAHFRAGKTREAADDFAESRRLDPQRPQSREELLATMQLTNQAINESFNKMAEHTAKLNADLKKANEPFKNHPLPATESKSPPAAAPKSPP